MLTKAIIFDLDGVITDTEPLHMEAWLSVLESLGISFEEDEYKANYVGLRDSSFLDVLGRIHGHHFSESEKAQLIEEKMLENLRILDKGIPLLPGVADFISTASKRYILSICSGALRTEIEFILKKLKWTALFDPVVAADEVKYGKPEPEGYIRALEGLVERSSDIILAENVVIIEDTPKGIAAAHAAGMRCIAVTNTFEASALSMADRIIQSLGDLDPDEI